MQSRSKGAWRKKNPWKKSHAISIHGAQGRIRTWHTCILFIVKSKKESMEKKVMQSRSKGASV